MNIARMCIVVGVAGLLMAQNDVHAMEQDNAQKEQKSFWQKHGSWITPTACMVLGFCGARIYYKNQWVQVHTVDRESEVVDLKQYVPKDMVVNVLSWLASQHTSVESSQASKSKLLIQCSGANRQPIYLIAPGVLNQVATTCGVDDVWQAGGQ